MFYNCVIFVKVNKRKVTHTHTHTYTHTHTHTHAHTHKLSRLKGFKSVGIGLQTENVTASNKPGTFNTVHFDVSHYQ